MGRGVSIAEVAARAGVGVGTVSRVLNGNARVSEETRRRVLAVMDDVGYRPNRMASGLSSGRTGFVAVLVPFLTRPSVVARLAGVISVMTERGLDTVVCDIETVEQRNRHLEAFVRRHSIDGLVAISLPIPGDYVERLRQLHLPLVLVDVDHPGVHRVVIDDVAGGRLATSHLIELGHERIAFVGDVKDRGLGFVSTDRRLAGYRRALAAAGIAADRDLERRIPHGAEPAAAAVAGLMAQERPPTAVFAASDTQALGLLQGAESLGLRVPGELSIVGFDDIEAAALVGLTTVRQPLKQSGVLGAEVLCALMDGSGSVPGRRQLALELVERSSTARLRRERAPTVGRVAGRRPARREAKEAKEALAAPV